jgi:UDP-GlcNAc:undecaprenyl-phosphate/decaprenyl-phosphate GlcNAc-1-phosphate transferase
MIWYLLLLLSSVLISSLYFSYLSLRIAKKLNIYDNPRSRPSIKKQSKPIPLLGASGLIFVGFSFSFLVYLISKFNFFNLSSLLKTNLDQANFVWVLVSILILSIGGFLDDKYNLSAKFLIIPVLLAVGVSVIFGGLTIEALSYPFDELLPNNKFLPYVLGFIWLIACTAATKFLDGLDGLVTTVGIIAFLMIASISFFANVFQPFTIILSLIWAISLCGYLPFNFPEAKSYLGEAGSEVIGFMIGVLSILSGAKVATANMVIGWFILDIILVFSTRLILKKSLFKADRLHWHFRLLDLGMNKFQVLILTTSLILFTSRLGLVASTGQKALLMISQFGVLVLVFVCPLILKKLFKFRSV